MSDALDPTPAPTADPAAPDQPPPSDTRDGPRFRIPPWAGLALCAACLVGFAWLGWRFLGPTAAGGRLEPLPRDPNDQVVASGWGRRSRWEVTGGMGKVIITRPVGAADVTFRFDWSDTAFFMTPEQVKVLSAVEQIVDKDPAGWTAKLGLSDAQTAALEAVRGRRNDGLQLDPADEQTLRKLFAAYDAAEKAVDKADKVAADAAKAAAANTPPAARPPRPAGGGPRRGPGGGPGGPPAAGSPRRPEDEARQAAVDRLCEAVEDIVRKKVAPVRRITADRVAVAKAALTADQWRKYDQLSNRPDAPPEGKGQRGR